jgi:hypothetical protein
MLIVFFKKNVTKNTSDYSRSKSYGPVFKTRNIHKFYERAIVEISRVISSVTYSQIKMYHISKLDNWSVD